MKVALADAERTHLRQLQKQRRDDEGYVKVTVVLLLDAGWGAGQVAQALGLDAGTGYRYAQAWAWKGSCGTRPPAIGVCCPRPGWRP